MHTGTAQYDDCPSYLSWLGDGFCDRDLNTPDCGYDGGDCCECTCMDGPEYACGINVPDCKDPSCLDKNLVEDFPSCGGNLLQWNDGKCDTENNNESCGYDGGDCCLCTCVTNVECRFYDLDCIDPIAEHPLYQCQPPRSSPAPCGADIQRTWIVEDTAQARTLAEVVNCSGGTFDVLWKGFVEIDTTIFVTDGTILSITGVHDPSPAVMAGGLYAQLLTAADAFLYVSDVSFSSGNSTVGGAITVSASNVTFTRTSFYDNRATGQGGALYVTNNSTVWFDGNTTRFINNSAVGYGGALYASSGSAVHFKGEKAHFLHNAAGERGGAIAIDQSKLLFSQEALFHNNTGGDIGGAVSIAGSSTTAWVGNLSFTENTAIEGGAVAVYLKSNVSWSGNTSFKHNKAVLHGGAIYIVGAQISWMGNTEFTSNTASYGAALSATSAADIFWSDTSSFFNNLSGKGGAIYINLGSFIRWKGSRTTFAFNIASSDSGGAIALFDSIMSWTGETIFEYNRASIAGGAIYIGKGDISWKGDTIFADNEAGDLGGALYVVEGNVSWNGNTTFTSNKATNVMGAAGAIMVSWAANVSWDGMTSLFNNSASAGGAMYVNGGSSVSWRGFKTTFISNIATSAFGGAIVISGSNLSWSGCTVLENNSAMLSAGGIYIAGALLPRGGNASNAPDPTAVVSGKVDNLVVAELSWSGATSFFNNSAMNGGSMGVYPGANVWWDGPNTTFASSTATSQHGGAISVLGANISWGGATFFMNNFASIVGGGVVVWNSSRIDWSGDTTFTANAAMTGGAIYVHREGMVKWTGHTTFDSNKASIAGGAVGSTALDATVDGELMSSLTISGTTTFVDNVCERDGGAMSMAGGLSLEFDPMANVTFHRNSAQAAGGAVFMSGSDIGPTFHRVNFISNTAHLGGAVYATSSGNAKIGPNGRETFNPTTFYKCSFSNNTAISTGGAIQSAAGQDYVIGTSFVGNTAKVGGALFLAGTSKFINCSFVGNVADEGAGPTISNIGYVAKMENIFFTGNDFSCAMGTYLTHKTVRSI